LNSCEREVSSEQEGLSVKTTIFGTRRIKRAQQQQTTTTQDNNNNNLPVARQQPTNNIGPWECGECHRASALHHLNWFIVEFAIASVPFYVEIM